MYFLSLFSLRLHNNLASQLTCRRLAKDRPNSPRHVGRKKERCPRGLFLCREKYYFSLSDAKYVSQSSVAVRSSKFGEYVRQTGNNNNHPVSFYYYWMGPSPPFHRRRRVVIGEETQGGFKDLMKISSLILMALWNFAHNLHNRAHFRNVLEVIPTCSRKRCCS